MFIENEILVIKFTKLGETQIYILVYHCKGILCVLFDRKSV